jgi:hypothetical protein
MQPVKTSDTVIKMKNPVGINSDNTELSYRLILQHVQLTCE